MAKRDNEFEKKKKKEKKKPPITRLSGLEIFRSIDGGIKIKGGGEGMRGIERLIQVRFSFFFCNPRTNIFQNSIRASLEMIRWDCMYRSYESNCRFGILIEQ